MWVDLEVARQENSCLSYRDAMDIALGNTAFKLDGIGSQPWIKDESFRWGHYDSTVGAYEAWFEDVLPSGDIAGLLRADVLSPVVVDLLSSTTALRGLFEQLAKMKPQLSPAGIALGLTDTRSDQVKAEDEVLNIQQTSGNLALSSGWGALNQAMGGRTADLIMARGLQGGYCLPNHALYYGQTVRKLWDMLSVNGTLLMDFSDTLLRMAGIKIENWFDLLGRNGIEAQHVTGLPGFRLVKSPDSPKKLPLL